jgi:hypothetical protein
MYMSFPDLEGSESETPQNYIRLNKNLTFVDTLEYTFLSNILGVVSNSDITGKMEIYLSGSSFPENTSQLGVKIGEYEIEEGKTRRLFTNQKINFIPSVEGFGVLNFVIYGGKWYFSNVIIQSAFETGFNPDEIEFLIPIEGKRFENLQFKVELFDPNNNYLPIEILSPIIFFDGGNELKRGIDNRIEGTLTVAPSGSGVTVTSEGWTSGSTFLTGESAIILGEGNLFNADTAFLVGTSGSDDSPFISIGDKLLGFVNPDTGDFELIVSGNITLISGTITADQIDVDRLSDININVGELELGRIQSGNVVGIQLGPEPGSGSEVPSSWVNYINLAASASQPFIFASPPSGTSLPAFKVTADGDATFGGNITSSLGFVENLTAPRMQTDDVGPRVFMQSFADDPGADLFVVSDGSGPDEGLPLVEVSKYTLTSGSPSNPQDATNWSPNTGSITVDDNTVGWEDAAAHPEIDVDSQGTLPAGDNKYTVR